MKNMSYQDIFYIKRVKILYHYLYASMIVASIILFSKKIVSIARVFVVIFIRNISMK